jgi:hypothetical protein
LAFLSPVILKFPLQFPLVVWLFNQVGRPQQDVFLAIRQNDKVVLLFKPQTDTPFPAPSISPNLDGRLSIPFDNRLGPADSLTATKIWSPFFLFLSFLNHVPEGHFLAVGHWVPLQAEPPALKNRIAVDEIPLEPDIWWSSKASSPSSKKRLRNRARWPA